MFSFPNGACSVVSSLVAHGFTLNHDFFVHRYEPWGERTALAEYPGVNVENTEFYARLLSYFQHKTLNWIKQLTEPVSPPDWHYILFPGEPLIEVLDYLMAGRDLPTALGYVIEAMNNQRLEPTGFVREPSGEITINTADGQVARIGKIKFDTVSELSLARATKALSGLQRGRDYDFFSKPLSKLPGYPKPLPGSRAPLREEGSEILHHTRKNLCIALDRALKPVIDKKIPQHLLQELVATLFNFGSWNHLTGAVKKREQQLWVPYLITHKAGWSLCADKGFSFYEGIAPAIAAFGQRLLSEENKRLCLDFGVGSGGICLTNRALALYRDLSESPFHEAEGLVLMQSWQAHCEDESVEMAAYLLADSEPEKLLNEYFFVGNGNKRRLIEFNKRKGVKEEHHLFIGDWVFWIKERDEHTDGIFCAEKVSEVGMHSYPEIISSLHKAALVTNEDGSIWLATDWDREPTHELSGLQLKDAEIVERTFIDRTNWRLFYES